MPLPARATALLTAARLPREPGSDAWHSASGEDPTEPIPVVAARSEKPAPRSPRAAARVRGAEVPSPGQNGAGGPGRPARDDVGPGRRLPGRTVPSASARDADGDDDADAVALPSRHLVRASDGVFQIPRGLQGARVSPPWAAVVGAAVVVIVAVAVVLAAVLRDSPAGEPVPTRPTHPDSAERATSFSATASPPPAAPAGTRAADAVTAVPSPTQAAPDLVVHVIGEVVKPGVVAVPAGARVKDAIAAAGGATRRAVLTGVNLARPVVDGEQIFVPDSQNAPIPVNTLPAPSATAGGPAAPSAQVDLNSADQATLEQLPGVGPVLALRILEWRAAHGRFTSVDELGEVSGVGEKKLESLRPHVRV